METLEQATSARKVLVVDDDPAVRLLCAIDLQRQGLVVIEACNGLEGLERARLDRPDLVLTDVMMPRLDGFQLAEALRRDEQTRQIPLIFLSGETSAASRARAHMVGALAFLTKPFDPSAIASLVSDALDRVLASPGPQAAA
jgi:CheY-like chemotaxis protein